MAGVRAAIQLPTDGTGKKVDSFSYDLADGIGTRYVNTFVVCDSNGNVVTTLGDGTGNTGLGMSMIATNYVVSTVNSTTTQLAAAATFTGGIETIFNQQAISLLITSDQTGLLTLNQYIDAGGTRLTSSWQFVVQAGVPYSRSFVGNGNYFNLTFKNNGAATTTTLNINTAYGTLPSSTNLGNEPVSLNEISGVAVASVPTGRLRVQLDPGAMFYEAWDAGTVDTVYNWNAATSSGGASTTPSAGNLAQATGTTASAYTYLTSRNKFQPVSPGYIQYTFAMVLPASIPANTYAAWGVGNPAATPSSTAMLTDSVSFEVATTGKMYAVCWAGGTRNQIADLSAATGNATQPTDGAMHQYLLWVRGDNVFWQIDGLTVASISTGALGPNTNLLPVFTMVGNAAVAPASGLTVNNGVVYLGSTNNNRQQIVDPVHPQNAATVLSTGSLQVAGYQPTPTTFSGITATGAQASTSVANFNVATLTLRTFTGSSASVTWRLQASDDNTNWVDLQGINNSTGQVGVSWTQTLALTGGTAGPSVDYTIGAYSNVRVNITAISGTTPVAAFGLSLQTMPYEASPGATAQGVSAAGSAILGSPVRIGGSDGANAQDVNVTAKAVQGTRGVAVQDLKDAGRSSVMVTAAVASTATTETLIAVSKSLGLAATTSASSNTITSGKRFRIQALVASVRNSTGTTASNVTLSIRAAVAGATTTASPLQFQSTVALPASTVTTLFPDLLIPDGFEIDSNSGLNTWGVTITHPQWVTGSVVATFNIAIIGYEY